VVLISSVRQRMTLALLTLLAAAPATAVAQNGFAITPWVGSYYALGKFFNDQFDLSTVGGTGTTNITVNQSNTVMVGVRATVPLGATLAAEGSFGYASSDVRFVVKDFIVNSSGQPIFDASHNFNGNVMIGSARLVLKPRRSNLSLLAGAIIVHHGGDAWSDSTITKKTNFGGVVGLGLRANVTPRFPIDIRAELNLYNFNPDTNDNAAQGFYPGKMQEDLVVSIGIPIGSR